MKTKTLQQTLKHLPSKYKKLIKILYDEKVPKIEKIVFDKKTLCRAKLNDEKRNILSECIFYIEQEIEYRGRKSDIRICKKLREARNALYDDLGWNENKKYVP